MGSIEANRFLGRPPMRVVMYTLAGEALGFDRNDIANSFSITI